MNLFLCFVYFQREFFACLFFVSPSFFIMFLIFLPPLSSAADERTRSEPDGSDRP